MPLPNPLSLICSPIHMIRGGTGGKGQHDDEGNETPHRKAVGVFHNALAAQVEVVSHALDEAQDNGDIPGDGGNLLAAFFPLPSHPLQQGMAMVNSCMMMELLI